VTWVFVDRNERSRIARRARLTDVSAVANFVLTVRTHPRLVDAADTRGVNDLITKARDQDEVVSTKTRLILDEELG